ncbi:uncharacterized protein MELLADRAFT_67834 [Melampsora larici-populina 98AG31]|uniref:Uncharacterized protein n=1 Tax=Melampsora larici-populina (strain 98AG31 / pathotype 3-4-7) TaxID=747676 RepID=F4S4L4_MELLP|nr:uncharacterized protein MELLADRAFT_67834 [Melampsora larici-populina 98AG31]EGG00435.1 hypothetical protein MELLADRAFT_67834 [Melampsora larici-populina 98AG31]
MYHHQPFSSHQPQPILPTTPLRSSLYQTHPAIVLDSRFDRFDELQNDDIYVSDDWCFVCSSQTKLKTICKRDFTDPLGGYPDGVNLLKNDTWVPNHSIFSSNTGQRKPTGLLGVHDDWPRNEGYSGDEALKDAQRSYDMSQLENTPNTYRSTRLFTSREPNLPLRSLYRDHADRSAEFDSADHPDRSKPSKASRHLGYHAPDSSSILERSTDADSLDDHSWSTSSFDYQKSNFDQPSTPSYTSSTDALSPILCDKWPVVRVDNISWGQTVEGILDWLPTQDCLPPSELCPLPIHILCTPADGKTLNYCFIEMRNLASAHLLVRHRHATKLNTRPCSVGLTSLKELHDNIVPDYSKGIMATAEELLRLCVASTVKDLKAPERPFLHLVSIILHYAVLPKIQIYSAAHGSNQSGEEHTRHDRLRMIYVLAMQSLIWSFVAQFGLVGLLDEVPNLNQWNNGPIRASRDNRFGCVANHPQCDPRIRPTHLGLKNHHLLSPTQNENQIEALLHEITHSRIPNMKDGENAYAFL